MGQIASTSSSARTDYESGIAMSEPESIFDASMSDGKLQEVVHELQLDIGLTYYADKAKARNRSTCQQQLTIISLIDPSLHAGVTCTQPNKIKTRLSNGATIRNEHFHVD